MPSTHQRARSIRTTTLLAAAVAGPLVAFLFSAAQGIGPGVAMAGAPPFAEQARHAAPWKGGQWEYATMTLAIGPDPADRGSPVITINGVRFRGYNEISLNLDLLRDARDVSEVLEALGGRGWELVAFDHADRVDNAAPTQTWIFKRPRPRS